jgi:hypothetical protein
MALATNKIGARSAQVVILFRITMRQLYQLELIKQQALAKNNFLSTYHRFKAVQLKPIERSQLSQLKMIPKQYLPK